MMKQFRFIGLAMFCALTISACGSDSKESAKGIYGTWLFDQQTDSSDGTILYKMLFTYTPNSVTVTSICTSDGVRVIAEASAAAKYSDSTVFILGSDSKSNSRESLKGTKVKCSASVEATSYDYSVLNGGTQLKLTNSSDTVTLPRVK